MEPAQENTDSTQPQKEEEKNEKIIEEEKKEDVPNREEENKEKEIKNTNSENNDNSEEKDKIIHENQNIINELKDKNQEYTKIIDELKLNLQEKDNLLKDLKTQEVEKEKILENLKKEKEFLQKNNTDLHTSISTLQTKIDQVNKEKASNDTKFEAEINNLKKSIDDLKTESKIMNQAAKQIFLQYLTNDIYIEPIEKCFNSQDINKYFENIYNLSEHIKPNIIIDYWKNLLAKNKELVNIIEKYNLDMSLENKINDFNKLKTLEDINKIENQEFIITLLKEMSDYITSLRKTIMNQSNNADDLKKQKSNLESKINSFTQIEDKYKEEIKNYTKKVNESNNTINSLNSEINKYKKENEKLTNEKRELLNEKNKSIQTEAGLTEKVSSSTQKCELYKIENFELMNKITENKTEIEEIKIKNETLKKQIEKYKEKTSNMEKMNQTLKEQDSQLILKENEIKKLKKSYDELEEFFENLKKEKENITQNNQKQLNELLNEKKNLEKLIEEKNNEINQYKGIDNNGSDPNNTGLKNNLNINNEKYEQMQNKIFNLELDNTNLKDQNNKLVAINKDLVSKLQNENKNYEKVVDKTMISSMLIKYFNPSTPSSIKSSLLETIANFLEYTDEEREQIGLPSKSGTGNDNAKTTGNNFSDHLSKIGNNLYNFITNS